MKNRVETKSRHNRLVNALNHSLLNDLLRFLGTALSPLIKLNLLLQGVDTIIHILYDSLFSCTFLLLRIFAQPELVQKRKRGNFLYEETKVETIDLDST